MKYPYFRGLEADRYSFYRVPKALIKVDLFEKMSGDAKLLYAVLLDRMNLSLKNGWQDENGNAYIICTIDEIMDSIRCARQKAVKLLDELEHEYQLIERRRQGFDYVVNACDAGREGEAIFRRVYGLAGGKLPVKRLWISSMEDSAIQQGFDSLKDGAEYDNLFAASECRAKADWLIGMNGTRAFTKKYGRRQTIGRVQTPTLAMLTERQNKIQNFVKEPYYKVEITGNGIVAESERMAQEQDADTMQAACDGQCAVVGSIERKRKEQSAPKLYDLTTLQREAKLRAWTKR